MPYQAEKMQEEELRLHRPEERHDREVSAKVRKLTELTKQIETLNREKAELEGYFLKLAEQDLADTKLRSASYAGPDGARVTATMAKSLKLVYPSYLRQVFGKAYQDAVTEEAKYKLSAPATRMLTGLWQKEYIKMTVAEAIDQITPDPGLRKALAKKVKGASFATDKKQLMAICGFDEKTAEDNAYFIAEAAVWQSFLRLLKVQGLSEDAERQYLDWIDGAVVVDETPKITVTAGNQLGEEFPKE